MRNQEAHKIRADMISGKTPKLLSEQDDQVKLKNNLRRNKKTNRNGIPIKHDDDLQKEQPKRASDFVSVDQARAKEEINDEETKLEHQRYLIEKVLDRY